MTHSRIGCWQMAAAAALLCVLFGTSAFGAATADEDAYQRALDEMLADIGDPQLSFDFVQAATKVGDLRGAVASLERMLLIDPGLANIELELGVLLMSLGNADLGQYHIQRALRAPNVPLVVRRRAERIMASSGGAVGRSFWRGRLSINGSHDSNVNSSPSMPEVLVLSGPGTLSSLEEPDSSFNFSLGATHVYAFAGNSGSSFETNLLAYASAYDEFSDQNLITGRVETGPALRLGRSPNSFFFLRPYLSVGYNLLDGEDYLRESGGGLELRAQPNVRTYGFLRADYSDQDFKDSATRIFSDRSGGYLTARAGISRLIGQSLQLSATVASVTADADASYQAFSRIGGGVGAKFFFGYGKSRPPWSIGLSANLRNTDYDAADPQVTVRIVREDERSDVALTIDVPVSQAALIALRYQYTKNESNIPNYQFENSGVDLGFSWRF